MGVLSQGKVGKLSWACRRQCWGERHNDDLIGTCLLDPVDSISEDAEFRWRAIRAKDPTWMWVKGNYHYLAPQLIGENSTVSYQRLMADVDPIKYANAHHGICDHKRSLLRASCADEYT
jgi:hypothetical protein